MQHDLSTVVPNFQIQGGFLSAQPYGSGHIHDTYEVVCDQAGTRVRYIAQRINHMVFKDVPALMENIARTTQHIRSKLEATDARSISRRVLTLVPATDGADYHQAPDGLFWRVYLFIEGARTYDILENDRQACAAAKAFGRFQGLLADLPLPRLHETIPNFHHTRSRFDALVQAVDANAAGRVDAAREAIAFALEREPMVDVLLDLHRRGELPERITHNDTKLNNVMIDDETCEGVCVIDLDTVMPGLALYDFGDMIRTGTNTAAEDERDLSKVSVNRGTYAALTQGYLESAGDFLTPKEIELLPFSGKLISFEIGLRFLTDYLSGDVYFKVHREGHNLDRCRTQFKLVSTLEEQEDALNQLVGAV
jgi:Ser/Thr protein kinase RdoA (MazF antagonist)